MGNNQDLKRELNDIANELEDILSNIGHIQHVHEVDLEDEHIALDRNIHRIDRLIEFIDMNEHLKAEEV